jgi:hypothetical protein
MDTAEYLQFKKEKRLKDGEGYSWSFKDYLLSPFGLLLGSLNALGGDSSASYCSRYTLSARELIFESEPYFLEDNKLDGYDYYHKSISYADNIAFSCYNAFSTEISVADLQELVSSPLTGIPVNLLYNIGYMWVDVINYYFYNYTTVPQEDWAFFFTYTFGDFFMRFLFNSSDAIDDTTR